MTQLAKGLQVLADRGVQVDTISEEKREILASLTDDEAAVLGRIVDKMASDVSGFAFNAGGFQSVKIQPSQLGGGLSLPNPSALDDSGAIFW